MAANLISVSRCASLSGLAADELVLGVTPSELHDQLYDSYRLDIEGGADVLRERIVADIRGCIDLGAQRRAADLLIVLRRVLARRAQIGRSAPSRMTPRSAATALPRNPRSAKNCVRCRAMGGLRFVSSSAGAIGAGKDNVFSFEAYRRKLRLASASLA